MAEKDSATNCDDDSSNLKFYPPKLWGLDFHFSVFNRMYICDILKMNQNPHFTGAFFYKNHPIYKVDVVGTVVKRVENSKCFIYAVDDGTGVVLCCCWKDSYYGNIASQERKSNLPANLQSKVREITEQNSATVQGYSLGDLVHMKGKLKLFRDKKEIMASYHRKIEDPSLIIYRMSELPKLYKLLYDCPFQLPYKVQQALETQKHSSNQTIQTVSDISGLLKSVIHDILLTSPHVVELRVADLLQYTKVKDTLNHLPPDQSNHEHQMMVLHTALCHLEDAGHVTRRADQRMLFEALLHHSKLEERIKTILITESKKPKCKERGCHYLHVLDELHKTLSYAKVKKEAVLYCLEKLEMQSDIIRATHAHYLPCDV